MPYGEFDASELAIQLHEAVSASRDELAARDLLGPIARYGASAELAEEKVRKGQNDENPTHFAVMNDSGNVVGAASIYEDLPLGKPNLHLPPATTRRAPGLYT